MATTKSKPVSIRLRITILDDCQKYKINKSKVCSEALTKEIADEKKRRKGN